MDAKFGKKDILMVLESIKQPSLMDQKMLSKITKQKLNGNAKVKKFY